MNTAFLSTTYIHRTLGRPALLLIPFLIACAALLPAARAVTPPPDGGYPGGNTAEGYLALGSLTTGTYNDAVGVYSLLSLTTGSFNTADGAGALLSNTADQNTATGAGALLSNATGEQNTANGAFALFSNTEGSFNTATGDQALLSNTTGVVNTAIGAGALAFNTTGARNTAIGGDFVLFSNTTGNFNTAIGVDALDFNTTGSSNIALGAFAGSNVVTASNVICIDAPGLDQSNACYIGQIFGAISFSGSAVFINSDGKLGTQPSSRRFKEQIKPMEGTSEALFALKPVTFRYKKEIDPARTSQFGLVAEEVEKVNPDLVVRDKGGKPYSVRYDQVNAMLLNEFLKEHRTVQEQGALIAKQQLQIEALTAGLQKVNDHLEASKSAPQLVTNP